MKPDIFSMLVDFTESRPVMADNNGDINMLLSLLVQEVDELFEDPKGMSKELYLEQELADVAIFAISALQLLTGDAHQALRSKNCRNNLKMPAYLWQHGTYEECRVKSKEQWTDADNEDFYSEQ